LALLVNPMKLLKDFLLVSSLNILGDLKMKIILTFLILILLCRGLWAKDFLPVDIAATSVLIKKDGKVIVKETKGCAVFSEDNQKCLQKANNDTALPIGSITKHFTAAIILMLEEDGLLSTDDKINKYLDLGKKFDNITILELLNHTAGVANYTTEETMKAVVEDNKKIDREFILNFIKNSKLGKKEFNYSNSGYFLLGEIIVKVSNKNLGEAFDYYIFKKFNMSNSFLYGFNNFPKNYGIAYDTYPLYNNIPLDIWYTSTDGAGWSSVNDYEKWIDAFDNKKIFKLEKTMEKFLKNTSITANNIYYDYGIVKTQKNFKGKIYNVIFHNGSLGDKGENARFLKVLDTNTWLFMAHNDIKAGTDFFQILSILEKYKLLY
jgi:CubicO group peptidase (beta-lactamase class C family)